MLCTHPDLPGQTAEMAFPRNGWTPVDGKAPRRRRTTKKAAAKKATAKKATATKTSPPDAGKDSPAAGSSKPNKDEE